jgi:hypothetical protein
VNIFLIITGVVLGVALVFVGKYLMSKLAALHSRVTVLERQAAQRVAAEVTAAAGKIG